MIIPANDTSKSPDLPPSPHSKAGTIPESQVFKREQERSQTIGLSYTDLREKLSPQRGTSHLSEIKAQLLSINMQIENCTKALETHPHAPSNLNDTINRLEATRKSLEARLDLAEQEVESAEIDTYLRTIEQNSSFRGSVLVTKDGVTILNKGYGMATQTKRNDASTVFHIGSVTKIFTSAAIMKLTEMEPKPGKQKIDLEASINRYLPKKYQSDRWAEVKVKELLSHTSGIPEYITNDYFDKCKSLTRDDVIKKAMTQELVNRNTFNYSNTGYLLLGAIIEEQRGCSYGEFMREVFFDPARMDATRVHDTTFQPTAHMATGFRREESSGDLVEDTTEDLSRICGADGAIYSSLQDLAQWSHILDGSQETQDILSSKLIQQMNPTAEGYGYGLPIQQKFGTTCISHDGLVPGFNSSFMKFPKEGIFIAVAGNTGLPSGIVSDHISEVVVNKVRIVSSNSRGDPDPRLGTFKTNTSDRQLKFIEREGRLFMQGLDGPDRSRECFRLSDGRLFEPTLGLKITYNGVFNAITVTQGGVVMDTFVREV